MVALVLEEFKGMTQWRQNFYILMRLHFKGPFIYYVSTFLELLDPLM